MFKIKLENTNLVIIADNGWLQKINNKKIANETIKNVQFLREYGYNGPILIISNRPTYKKNVFEIIKEYGAIGDGVNKFATKYLINTKDKLLSIDNKAEIFYKTNKIYYYSLVNTFCVDDECRIIYDGMPLYHDRTHLTMSGAKYVGLDLVKFIDKNIRGKKAYVSPSKNMPHDELNINLNKCEMDKPYKGTPLIMSWSGSITTPTYELEKNSYNLIINARGSKAFDQYAKLRIQVYKFKKDIKSLLVEKTIDTDKDFTSFILPFEIKKNSKVLFVISFINDKGRAKPKEDRNVYLKSIILEKQLK